MAEQERIATRLEKVEAAIKKAWDSDEFKEFMTRRGFDMVYMDSAGYGEFMKSDDADNGAALKSLGYSLNTRDEKQLVEARDVVVRLLGAPDELALRSHERAVAAGEEPLALILVGHRHVAPEQADHPGSRIVRSSSSKK